MTPGNPLEVDCFYASLCSAEHVHLYGNSALKDGGRGPPYE